MISVSQRGGGQNVNILILYNLKKHCLKLTIFPYHFRYQSPQYGFQVRHFKMSFSKFGNTSGKILKYETICSNYY